MKSCCLLYLLMLSFIPKRMTGQQIKIPHSTFSSRGIASCVLLDPRLAVCFHLALLH